MEKVKFVLEDKSQEEEFYEAFGTRFPPIVPGKIHKIAYVGEDVVFYKRIYHGGIRIYHVQKATVVIPEAGARKARHLEYMVMIAAEEPDEVRQAKEVLEKVLSTGEVKLKLVRLA